MKKYWKLYRGTEINTAGDIAWLPEFGSHCLHTVLREFEYQLDLTCKDHLRIESSEAKEAAKEMYFQAR